MSTTLPVALGGLGLRSAERSRWPAFWSSWADTRLMIKERHPEVAEVIAHHLESGGTSPRLDSARRAAVVLDGVDGFQVPSWSDVASGLRPPVIGDEDREPGVPRQWWQHAAASCVEADFHAATLMPRMNPVERTLLRSQSGPCAGGPFTTCPISPLTRIDSTVLVITAQHVQGQGLWGGGGFHWRVRSPGRRQSRHQHVGERYGLGEFLLQATVGC